jgi:carboxyl-terminal processing protease
MENRTELKKLASYLGVFLITCLVFISGLYIGRANPSQNEAINVKYQLTGELKSEYQDVSVDILWEAWQRLEQEYISSDLNAQDMIYGAVKGMVNSLEDPYTSFLTPEEVTEYFKSNAGEYEGIGATLKQVGAYVAVESPIDGTPAQKAGLKPGDLITSVAGEDVVNKSVYEVVGLIRGEAGTNVEIVIYRESDLKEYTFSIIRERIDIDNIVLEDLGNGYYKIKIYKFTEASLDEFNALWDLVAADILLKNPKGLVIDLRNNPGGYVSAVEYILADFIETGKVIFIEENNNGVRLEHKVTRNGRLLDVPIVVLVNNGSASASEIFAGAIQDYARGKIIGSETVGKGVEQKMINLTDGSILQVVFQRWLTPMGKNISKEDPITPDVIIEETELTDTKAIEILQGN